MADHKKPTISNVFLMPVGIAVTAWAVHQIAEGRLIGRGTITTVHESPVLFWIFLLAEVLLGLFMFFIGFCATFNLFPGFIKKVERLAKWVDQFSLSKRHVKK
jgi:hypothetical protein